MKTCTTILLALLFGFKAHAQSNTEKPLFTSIDIAIKKPKDVYRLSITDSLEFGKLQLLKNFENLEYLSLKGDGLRTLPIELFELKKLKALDLSGNQIEVLPNEFINLIALQELYLDNETNLDFEQAIGVVSKLPKLKVLSLRNDSLLSLPESISNLKSLQLLDLGGNQIQALPKSIVALENLEELYLDHDSNLDFRSAFLILGGLPRLKVLHLEGNALISLPETINKLRSLEKLYLNENELSVVDLRRKELGKLMLVDVKDNPIRANSMEYLERTGVRINF